MSSVNDSKDKSKKETENLPEKFITYCFECESINCKHIYNCCKFPESLLLKYKCIKISNPPGGLAIE